MYIFVIVRLFHVQPCRFSHALTSTNRYKKFYGVQHIGQTVGEDVYLFGQPGGKLWSGNNAPEKVRVARTTEIEVESNTVIPGLSGGATLDEGLRIVGIIIETDNGVARSIPVRRLKEIIESGGYPFMLEDTRSSLSFGDGSSLISIGQPFKLYPGEVYDLPTGEMLSFRFESSRENEEGIRITAGSETSDALYRGKFFAPSNGCQIDYIDFDHSDPKTETATLRVTKC